MTWRLTIKVFRALLCSTSRRCPLDTRHLLKKVDENFICRNWVPRSRWRPTVHWKVGLECTKRQFAGNFFSYKKFPNRQEKILLPIFPSKGASNDKVFRTLRRATKGFAFGNHSLLKKAGENFILQKLGAAR